MQRVFRFGWKLLLQSEIPNRSNVLMFPTF